jgi:ribonucrease Y
MEIRALLQPWRRAEPTREDGGEVREASGGSVAEELAARRAEIARMEERALRETESLEVQHADLGRRTQALEDRERNLGQQSEELKRAKRVQRRELERISGLRASQAKQLLLADVEQEARHQAGVRLQEIEAETKREAERRARNILSVAMQ